MYSLEVINPKILNVIGYTHGQGTRRNVIQQNYMENRKSSGQVKKCFVIFPFAVLCDLLSGCWLGVSRVEGVHVLCSFMGDTLYREKERGVKHGAIRLKRYPQGGLIISPASAM